MPPIHFKLTKSDGHTRRVTFQELPTWQRLANKLQELYDVPVDKVGVSYIDNDNDEITASSNEELQDFYQTSHQPGQVIKFNVLDLTIPRDISQLPNPSRNTFGQDNFDFPDSDWQRLGPFAVADYMDTPSEGPHAFVEIVNSDVSSFAKDHGDTTDTDSEDAQSTVQPGFVDKGKRKASSFGAASITSVVNEEPSQKYPVHVFDHASAKGPAGQPVESIPGDPQAQIAAQSTPRVQSENLNPPEIEGNLPDTSESANAEDPPLPSLDAPPQSNASATLSHDLATLLNNFNSVISSHPELSEGVRNIIQNASSGAYWEAHRSALTQVMNDLQQPAERFEEDAARRVSDALDGIFRSLSLAPGNAASQNPPQESTQSTQQQRPFPWYQPPYGAGRPWSRRHTMAFVPSVPHRPWANPYWPPWSFDGMPPPHGPQGPPPPGPPPPPMHFSHGPPPPPPAQPPPIPPLPPTSPPRPPSPPFNPPPGPPPHSFPYHGAPGPPPAHDHPSRGPPMTGSPRHGHHYLHHLHHGPRGRGGYHHPAFGPHHRPLPQPVGPPPYPATTVGNPLAEETGTVPLFTSYAGSMHKAEQSDSKPTTQQLRAQVEETKRAYKAQKEAYRREREERRKANEVGDGNNTTAIPSGNAAESQGPSQIATTSQIVSNAWGSYPQFELYSAGAPRRHNTHPGHGPLRRGDSSRRTDGKPGDLSTRTQARIARRLADMGFSEQSHPDLPEKIKTQMPANRVISKEEEDDIVTTLLEELLAQASKPPVAPRSGLLEELLQASKSPAASGSGLGDKVTTPGDWEL